MSDNKIYLIVGLGLIGGSYAKALKENGETVYAIDKNKESIEYALKNGIIDKGDTFDNDLVNKADVIIIGLYPKLAVEWVINNQQSFKPGIYITDVSGVKSGIVDSIQKNLRKDVEFIACHPMAGKETSGVQNSDASIFKVANFIVVPTEDNTKEGIEFGLELGKKLGFKNITKLSVDEHDEMIGYLSQLTHAIAVSLMNANDNENLVLYTGDSFRDLTRIAKINETLWSELFFLNKENLIDEIDQFTAELENLKSKLQNDDEDGLKELFINSTKRRKMFDKK